MKKLHKNQKGQAFIEALFVIPILFMLFMFIVETGFLMYNWAVLNFQNSNAAVISATQGQFTSDTRIRLAQNINDWTINSQDYNYDISGTLPPSDPDKETVYIYGTDSSTPIQRGHYINVSVNYPWNFKFLMIDSLASFVVSEQNIRLKVNATVPSEVFNESL